MSKNFEAGQYELGYIPKRLGNWQQPRPDQTKMPGSSKTLNQKKHTLQQTKQIVDANGHIRSGYKRIYNGFTPLCDDTASQTVPRWPKKNSSYKTGPKSTLGYKGIQTSYLPSNTVHIKAYMVDGAKDFNYL